jgi:hypothetical protein
VTDRRPSPRPIALAVPSNASGSSAIAVRVPIPRRRDKATYRNSVPWTAEDLVRWIFASAVGGVLVGVGWYVAAGQARDTHQIGPLDLAIAGAVLGGVANVIWLLRGWHAVGERRTALVAQLSADLRPAESDGPFRGGDAEPTWHAGALVGRQSRYFHRPTCPLAAGRGWSPEPLAEHLRAGRAPCGVCKP